MCLYARRKFPQHFTFKQSSRASQLWAFCINALFLLPLHTLPYLYYIFLFISVLWQVHLITKAIYETLDGDFNNTMHVLAKIIVVNRLGFYVALTLFWALYLSFFEKDAHHYYRLYDRTKFFKLLHSSEGKEYAFEKIFKLLMLISIYQNHVLLNNDPLPSHETFQEFFKASSSSTNEKDLEKLKTYLMNLKALMERSNRVSSKQNTDALMVRTIFYVRKAFT